MTIATSASDRASGPVNVSARLLAARSQGDCAKSEREDGQPGGGSDDSAAHTNLLATVLTEDLSYEQTYVNYIKRKAQHHP